MLGESQRLRGLVDAVRAAAEARTLAQLGGDAFRSLAVALDASPALMFEMGAGTSTPAPTAVAGEHAPLFSRYVTDFLEDDLPHNPAAFRHQPIRAPMQSEIYRRSRVYRDFYRANGISDKLHMLVAGNGSFEPGAVAMSLTRISHIPPSRRRRDALSAGAAATRSSPRSWTMPPRVPSWPSTAPAACSGSRRARRGSSSRRPAGAAPCPSGSWTRPEGSGGS